MGPRRVEAQTQKKWTPKRVEPRRVGPRRVEPRRVEPRRVEPRRVEPRRVEPSPGGWSPGGWSPGGWSPGGWSPGGWSPGGWSPGGWSPGGWSPNVEKVGPRGWGPEGWSPKGWSPKGWIPELVDPAGWGAQNFALFFPSTIFFLLALSWGPFVEFWWCLKRRGGPEMCTFGVLGLSCASPSGPVWWGRRGFTRQPESPNVHISGPLPSKTPTKFNKRTPRERKKNENCGGKREKKKAKFWVVRRRAVRRRAVRRRAVRRRGPSAMGCRVRGFGFSSGFSDENRNRTKNKKKWR